MNYKIRRACLADAESLAAYMHLIISEKMPVLYLKSTSPTIADMIAFIGSHSNPRVSLLLVVTDDERIIGILDATVNKNAQRAHCLTFGMSVLNECRRQGVGGTLLTELFLWAKKHQLKRIELEVFSNNYSAIKLYQKMGFLVEGVKKQAVRVDTEYLDIVHMARLVD